MKDKSDKKSEKTKFIKSVGLGHFDITYKRPELYKKQNLLRR